MTQQIRPSQFIFTYGPGAILESPTGPVIVRDLTEMIGELNAKGETNLAKFEILDRRLTTGRLHPELDFQEPWRILRVPSNAELGWPEGKKIFPAWGFPNWCLCTRHKMGILYRTNDGCPECRTPVDLDKRRKAGREAFRFVRACQDGHLDEVPWVEFVHQNMDNCGTPHLEMVGHGGALEDVRLRCPVDTCDGHAGRKLLDLYREPWTCSSRHAHRSEGAPAKACTRKMTLQQRGALSLFQPEIVTSLTLEPVSWATYDLAHRLLPAFRGVINTSEAYGQDFNVLADEVAAKLLARGHLGGAASEQRVGTLAQEILGDWPGLLDLLLRFDGRRAPDTRPRRLAEFERLLSAAENGAPAVPGLRMGDPPLFEVPGPAIRRNLVWGPGGKGPRFRVAPVTRVREVVVQAGFRRMLAQDGSIPKLVSAWEGPPQRYQGEDVRFFPGIERYGEGIFLHFEDPLVPASWTGPRWNAWMSQWNASDDSRGPWNPDRPFRHPIHPLEVWWHTLSHRLIRSLSLDAGYSSSALRERIFFDPPAGGGMPKGGLLIYAVQSGGDGTLGGLTALAGHLEDILNDSVHDLDTCSNGPVCDEGVELRDGAACYACLYASETSCEFRNQGLDRSLLLETLL